MVNGASDSTLIGRAPEGQALEHLLERVRAGQSRTLILRGEPGAGKSALLEHLVGKASGWRIARAAGVESETDFEYAGLHQLCAPLLDHRECLPAPQRTALEAAFGLSVESAPDRFVVGLAVLGLLSEVGAKRPLACVVDDVQWLDRPSMQIIGFVARRLSTERIALVCAARAGVGDDVLAGLPALAVRGLADGDARALLLGDFHGPLDAAVCDQIIAESHGKPSALLELTRTWSAADLAGGFGLPGSGPPAGKAEQTFRQRLDLLPSETQLLVLAAAAEPLGDPVLLHRAAEALSIDIAALHPAVDAGLIQMDRHVVFANPRIRSAAYGSAPADDRHRAHRALAYATDAEADPEWRAWHRARAASGPDEELATELERAAGRAQARGGIAARAAFLQRSVALTVDPARRRERALGAAQAALQVGAFNAVLGLLATAEDGAPDELQCARTDLLRAQLSLAASRATEATPLLLAAAQRLEPLDVPLARETYVDAFSAALLGARLNNGIGVPAVAHAACAAPHRPEAEPATADLLLDALVALADDYATAVPRCREALKRFSGEIAADERLRWLWPSSVVALEVWDDAGAYSLSDRSVQMARETGTLTQLAAALSTRTPMLVFCGELSAAARTVAEARSLHRTTEIKSATYGALILEAWRGNQAETREQIETMLREASSRGEGIGVAISEYARAVLCNGLGQYEEALLAACSASEHKEVVVENWGLSELIEAATRTGRADLATDALERLTRKARAAGTDWALGIEARSRALLSEGARAESHFRAALAHLGRTRVRAELARAHLLYGEWLRRENRRRDARTQLRAAHDQFTSIGLEGFAERARSELSATGESVPRRTVDSRDDLTAQERQIARLAGDGLSNPEIGARLFLSPRTVEWHLHNVFSKLGIRSRRELPRGLVSSASQLAQA
jgi:DNA-binding CsgD family transcriptional regulator